jgi:uncharacterized membrane protein
MMGRRELTMWIAAWGKVEVVVVVVAVVQIVDDVVVQLSERVTTPRASDWRHNSVYHAI